jgi:hypothetical protein
VLATVANETRWRDLTELLRGRPRDDRGLGALDRRGDDAPFIAGNLPRLLPPVRDICAVLVPPRTRSCLILYGGGGDVLFSVRDRCPDARIDVVDVPELLAQLRPLVETSTTTNLLRADEVGPGSRFDLVVVPHVCRGMSDAQVVGLLRTSAARLGAEGKILLIDVLSDPTSQGFTPWMDLSLFVNTRSGRIRSTTELAHVAQKAGLAVEAAATAPPVVGTLMRS